MADIYADEAHRLVDEVIDKACQRILSETNLKLSTDTNVTLKDDKLLKGTEERDTTSDTKIENVLPNIKWMNIQDFSVEDGLLKIEQFIQTWKRDTSWLHCIDFLKEEDCPYSKRYRYEVKWSIPTRRKPIPRATASTYFTVDVDKVKPKNYPVEVYYIFEGHQLVHRPGKTIFNEKWLKDIIESKIHLMAFIKF